MNEDREEALYDLLANLYIETELAMAEKAMPDDVEVSDRFKRKIRNIILLERGIAIARKVAAVFLIFVLGFATLVMINEDVRAAVVRFFKTTFATHTTYQGNEEAISNEDVFLIYEPTWVPEGYKLKYRHVDVDFGLTLMYTNGECDEVKDLFFSCNKIGSAATSYNTEKTTLHKVKLGNISAEYYESYEEGFPSSLVWSDGVDTIFCVTGEVPYSELEKIANSIKANAEAYKEADDADIDGTRYTFSSREDFYDEGRIRYLYEDNETHEFIEIDGKIE